MSLAEVSIWAAMAGALLTLLVAALGDALRNPSAATLRGVAFVLVTGGSAVLMSGWPEHLAGIHDPSWLMPAKVSLGPLAGALALTYLGIWLGKLFEDDVLRHIIEWGGLSQSVAAAALLIWGLLAPESWRTVLWVAAAVNASSVVLAMAAAVRGLVLGDDLAKGMVVACAMLGSMVFGLYSKGLGLSSSLLLWGFTAVCTVAYFLICTVLTLQRNQQMRALKKIATGSTKVDGVTGLPIGAHFVSRVDDALWRSVRFEKECALVAVWVDNLYEFNDSIDHSVEQEIRYTLTARIRRTLGFRHVLGLQQARCFVSAISQVSDRAKVRSAMLELVERTGQPMRVGLIQGKAEPYTPHIGIGLLFVPPDCAGQPLPVIDQVQALARLALNSDADYLEEVAEAPLPLGVSPTQMG